MVVFWKGLPLAFRQLVCYGTIGTLSFVSDFFFYAFLTRIVGLHYVVANVCSFAVIGTINFLANRWLTFDHRGAPQVGQYLKFFLVAGTGLVLNTTMLVILVRLFGIYDLVAKACAAMIVFFWNFGMNRFWTFRHPNAATPPRGL